MCTGPKNYLTMLYFICRICNYLIISVWVGEKQDLQLINVLSFCHRGVRGFAAVSLGFLDFSVERRASQDAVLPKIEHF